MVLRTGRPSKNTRHDVRLAKPVFPPKECYLFVYFRHHDFGKNFLALKDRSTEVANEAALIFPPVLDGRLSTRPLET